MGIQLNPYIQTNAAGMFNIESDGFVVGTAHPDPSSRNWLAGGWLAATETLPMYGGLAISENIPQERPPVTRVDTALGGAIARATVNTANVAAAGSITGFSVFDQNYAAVNTPQSPCPSVSNGGLVNFYRFGSNARIVLAIDPALVTLEGGLITQQVSWDLANLRIMAFATNALPVKVLQIRTTNCMVPVYNSGTGFVTWNMNGAACLVQL